MAISAHELYHDRYLKAADTGDLVDNDADNLRFLALQLYARGGAGDLAAMPVDKREAILDTLLDAGEGRPFRPLSYA